MTTKRTETALIDSPAIEDYLEAIYNLIETKGEARSADVARNLGISHGSVTNMIKRLSIEGYVVYERYRSLTLTELGHKIGREVALRHDVLSRLLSGFGVDAATLHRDVEGMEHHMSEQTLAVLTLLMEELEGNAELMRKLKLRLKNRK